MKKILLGVVIALALLIPLAIVIADDEVLTSGAPVYLLEAQKCKDVAYSDWSECLTGFNLQIRYIVDAPYGCLPTTKQQIETLRFCDTHEYFGYSVK